METTRRPLRLLILGATGRIGGQLLQQATQRGHSVTAFVRSPGKLGRFGSSVNAVGGDPLDASAVRAMLTGHDAVLSALGPAGLGRSTVQQDGARAVVEAMQRGPVRRLLLVSAAMLFKDAGLLAAIVRTTILRNVAADCVQAEAAVTASDLDWTIVRPPRLTNGPITRRYAVARGHMPKGATGLLSRADVAHFLLDEAERAEHVHQVVGIG